MGRRGGGVSNGVKLAGLGRSGGFLEVRSERELGWEASRVVGWEALDAGPRNIA